MKDLNSLVADNKAVPPNPNPPALNDVLLKALNTAKESLKDVMQHGAGRAQLQNINHTDLPILYAAIHRLKQEMGR